MRLSEDMAVYFVARLLDGSFRVMKRIPLFASFGRRLRQEILKPQVERLDLLHREVERIADRQKANTAGQSSVLGSASAPSTASPAGIEKPMVLSPSNTEKAELTDQELFLIIPILHRLLGANKETRAKIQKFGIYVLPINYYSNTPSIEEIENSFEYASDEPPYFNAGLFDKTRFRETLEKILEFSAEFNPPADGNEEECRRFFWKNSMFSYSDAMSYYCFVRLARPTTIVEIGSGFSTLVALEAIEQNGSGIVHCIEPFPREFLKSDARITLHTKKAQDIDSEFLNDLLRDNDIFFIDSTHTVKTGSDCLHIYLRLLPKIRRNVFVHVHDVFLPFGMPKDWLLNHQFFWTEQFLLLAFLIDNPKASLLYGSAVNAKWHTALMEAFMRGKYPIGGGSVWFKYYGNTSSNSG